MAYKIATVNLIFDGPPSHEGAKFIEAEDEEGNSINIGDWLPHGGKNLWKLRLQIVIQVSEK